MHKIHIVLTAAASLVIAAGAAQAQQSWGPKHTTYWNSDSTGKFEPGQFMATTMLPTAQPATTQIQMRTQMRPQRMYYQQPGKRVRAPMRVRQQQPPMKQGQPPQGAPPAERTDQPPADAKPSAPPTQGEPPATPGATPPK